MKINLIAILLFACSLLSSQTIVNVGSYLPKKLESNTVYKLQNKAVYQITDTAISGTVEK